MAAKGYIEIDQVICKGCEICIAFCPKKSLSVSDKINAAGYFPAAFNDGANAPAAPSAPWYARKPP